MLAVKPFGKVVICGATSGYQLDFDVRYLWMRQKEIIGSHFANAWEATKANELIEQSKIRPVLWKTMGFERSPRRISCCETTNTSARSASWSAPAPKAGQDRRRSRRNPSGGWLT